MQNRMEQQQIKFEDLPQATSDIMSEVKALRSTVEQLVCELKSSPSSDNKEEMVGIDEACRILGLKKPTVYHKAQRREIKSYKPKGSKMLMFKRSELIEWMENKGMEIDTASMLADLQREVRHKPKSLLGGR